MPSDLVEEFVSLLAARTRYGQLSRENPKSYDQMVLDSLDEQIEIVKLRIRERHEKAEQHKRKTVYRPLNCEKNSQLL